MVGTRKTKGLDTTYSQAPAKDIWRREEEAAAEATAADDKKASELQPLSMADGGHLILKLHSDDGVSDEEESVDSQTPSERESLQQAFLLGTQESDAANQETEAATTPSPEASVLTQRTEEGAQLLLDLFDNAGPTTTTAPEPARTVIRGPSTDPNSTFRRYSRPVQPNAGPPRATTIQHENQWQLPPPARVQVNPYATSLAYRINEQMNRDGLGVNAELTTEELNAAEDTNDGSTSAAHLRACQTAERKVFDTIRKYGNQAMQQLIELVACWYNPTGPADFAFFNIVGGPKQPAKRLILNKILVLCALKWKRLDNHKPYQPNVFSKYMDRAFSQFKTKNVLYDYKKDFNNAGEFAGVVHKLWKKIRMVDPTFGVNPNRKRVSSDFLRLLRKAIREKIINIYTDAEDALDMMIFVNGFYCGLRGREEHANLAVAAIVGGTYTFDQGGEDMEGLEYAGLNLPWHKAQQLKLTKTSLPPETKTNITYCEDPEDADFCPVKFTRFFRARCHPQAEKFYAAILATQNQRSEYRQQYPENEIGIWYRPSSFKEDKSGNLGHNMIGNRMKKFAKKCGVQGWQNCTGHALRALMISNAISNNLNSTLVAQGARHGSLNSQKGYNNKDGAQEAARQSAYNLNGKARAKKRKPDSNAESSAIKKKKIPHDEKKQDNNQLSLINNVPTFASAPNPSTLSCDGSAPGRSGAAGHPPGPPGPPEWVIDESPTTTAIAKLKRERELLILQAEVAAMRDRQQRPITPAMPYPPMYGQMPPPLNGSYQQYGPPMPSPYLQQQNFDHQRGAQLAYPQQNWHQPPYPNYQSGHQSGRDSTPLPPYPPYPLPGQQNPFYPHGGSY